MMSAIKRLMEKQSVEPEVVHLIKSLAKALIFDDTIYVSAAGDDSDGSSLDRAYTSLTTALDWIEAHQVAGQAHLIILGAGTWDMDITGVPTYTANIAIFGTDSRHQAIIVNNHATATGVLRFTGWCSINNVSINCGTGETGIILNGALANGSRLRKLYFDCTALAIPQNAILLDGGVQNVKIWDIHVDGEAANTTVIHLNNAAHNIIQEVKVHTALLGIHLDHADDDYNEFYDVHLVDCQVGMQIDNAGSIDNIFHILKLQNNIANIVDNGTGTLFAEVFLAAAVASVFPNDLTGIAITAAAGANNWTAVAVQIRAASATPFYIVGITFECAAAERYGLRLYSDGGTTPIYDDVLETGAAIAGKTEFSELNPIWVNQGLAIHGRIKSETGGNNMNVWVKLQIV